MMTTSPWPFLPSKRVQELSHSQGVWLHMADGTRLLDAAGGAIVVNVGHGRRDIAETLSKAIQQNTYAVPPWLTPEREALVAELRGHWLPDHLPRVHLASGGSEANESAIKIAIQYQM
ncbi:MAG: aminotransferase class III-fold pyridoxal phosphate-dependent enzyme, partial [Gammaproteobacteria bacterium]|nr:aminotransferase class III-fold pyridoxal phosphate-dependent enzyme [Gammaproteobacteria bacterium]